MLGNLRIGVGVSGAMLGAGLLIAIMFGDRSAAREELQAVVPLLSSGETIVGERIVYPTGAPAKITAAVVTLAPGQETGWHTHGMPTFGYVIEGELEVDYGEKGMRVYRAGDAVLEATAIPHNGRNPGTVPMRILAVFVGADGLKTSEPAPR